MDLLNTIAEKKLLEESIEVLHQQSISWMNQIAFWQDENRFFKDLVSNRLFNYISTADQAVISETFKKIDGGSLEALHENVFRHEKLLSRILREQNSQERDYREDHKRLMHQFNEMEGKIKTLKTGIFELVKLVNKNFFNGNETLNIIYERRAVRKYSNKPVPRNHVEQLISAAALAPSSVNRNSFYFYVLTDKARIKRYSNEIIAAADKSYDELLQKIIVEEDPVFHGAPVVVFFATEGDSRWGPVDTGFAAENLMLAAKSMGYDSCPVGLARLIEKTQAYKELNIPSSQKVQLAVVLGFGDEQIPPRPHREASIHFV